MSGPPILDVRGLCVGIWSGKTELSAQTFRSGPIQARSWRS
jgi:hypothetical protein